MGFLDAFKAMLWSRLRRERAAAGRAQQQSPLFSPISANAGRENKVRLTHCEDIA
jgi:hypothetical protein